MTVDKSLPFSAEVFAEIAEAYGTPTYVYDEVGIRTNARAVNTAFSWSPNYTNYFAVKATPIPAVLRTVQDEGMGFDCSSLTELMMVDQQVGGDSPIFYTSNNTPDNDYRFANLIGATINVDKMPYVRQVRHALGALPTRMAIRYNPGALKKGNETIGDPYYAKFGDTEEHVLEALEQMRDGGVQEFGLHTMVASNAKDPEYFKDTARLLRELSEKAHDLAGVDISFINVGGGIGVNYDPNDPEDITVDVAAIGEAVGSELGSLGIPILSENGRYVTGPHGYFLTRVTHGIIESYQRFLQVDTSVNNMARLATVSAAHHEITILGRDGDECQDMTLTGSMCANSDKFLKNKLLPKTVKPGDLLIIHDAGAHMQANSHNYNGLPRAGGVIVNADGSISRAMFPETQEDILARTRGL